MSNTTGARPRPYITFMTDFGTRDDSAGCCRGVMLGRAPDAVLVDLTHEIPPFDIRRGALTWGNVLPYMPIGVHVGVVDPGVGTARWPIAVRTARGDYVVGPDNGLVRAGADALGGAVEAVVLDNPSYILEPRSNTFHGRDIFAPAAAALATGASLAGLGSALSPEALVRLELPVPWWEGDAIHCIVSYVDHYGNLRLNADADSIAGWGLGEGDIIEISVGAEPLRAPLVTSFGNVDPLCPAVIVDSYRRLMLAVNQSSAATAYSVAIDQAVVLRRP